MRGKIKKIIFENPESGYVVAEFLEEGKSLPIVMTGEMPRVSTKAHLLEVYGNWVVHQRFGKQFKASSITPLKPSTNEGVVEYLSSGIIKGIGPAIAQRIVAHFGDSALDITTKTPERLIEIKGIGKKKCDKIVRNIKNNEELNAIEILTFLKAYELPVGMAGRLHRKYGNEAIEVIKENPYRLTNDFSEIAFEDSDRVARAMGFPLDSPVRVREGLCHTIYKHIRKGGHVYCEKDLLVKEAQKKLSLNGEVEENLDFLTLDGGRLVVEESRVYLETFFRAEKEVAGNIGRLLCEKPIDRLRGRTVERAMHIAEFSLGISFEDKQKEAVEKSLREKITIVTGGPGTGKTTIIRAILESLKASNSRVMLAAPTGRAAKRMEQVTDHEAQTLHRLLEYSMETGGFQRHKGNPLEVDFLIVDEASMIDMFLMLALTDALPSKASLVLVGDVDQLPPVGPGSVLNDIIASGVVPVISLHQIFRQAQKSNIITNSHLINSGEMPVLKNHLDSNFFFLSEKNPTNIDSAIADLVARRIPEHYGYNPKTDVQVLSPMKKGPGGVHALNKALQDRLNPQGARSPVIRSFRQGDKVMHMKNNYDLDVYNGDIGYIKLCDREEGIIRVVYDQDKEVDYSGEDINDLVLAYASSIHKSQGSEYPVVIICLMSHHHIMLQKKLIYTAVTRGKELVIIVGEPSALKAAVATGDSERRNTTLSGRIESLTMGFDIVAISDTASAATDASIITSLATKEVQGEEFNQRPLFA